MKYIRTDKGDGSEREVGRVDVLVALQYTYENAEEVLSELEAGKKVQTIFAYYSTRLT